MATVSEANVLMIGISDGLCRNQNLSPFESKIGGLPDFFSNLYLEKAPCCFSCNNHMILMCQAYCPLHDSPYHRLLHVFACYQPSCKSIGSWLVLRSQQRDSTSLSHIESSDATSIFDVTDWCNGADEWGDNEASPDDGVNEVASIEHEVPMMTEAFDRLKLCGNVYHGPSYPSLYLRILTSSEDNGRGKQDDYLMARAERLMAQYLENSRLEGEDYYEKDQMNEPFLKFKKKLADYPNQLIRYQWKGHPLSMNDDITPVDVKCKHCNGSCVFELQLMPQIIYLLQDQLGTDQNVIEFGTVLVYTCEKSCWIDLKDEFRTEHCIIQHEQ